MRILSAFSGLAILFECHVQVVRIGVVNLKIPHFVVDRLPTGLARFHQVCRNFVLAANHHLLYISILMEIDEADTPPLKGNLHTGMWQPFPVHAIGITGDDNHLCFH